MSSPAVNRGLWIKLGLAVLLLGALGAVLLLGFPVRVWFDAILEWLRGLGPLPFFGAMVLLPAFGFPMIFFSGSVGSLFAPTWGWPFVVGLMAAGMVGNLALTYWLARYAFRPLLLRLIGRLGYQLPVVETEDQLGLAVLVRVTPGPPFFVQSYLLGLAEIRFRTYLWVSLALGMTYGLSFAYFGSALLQGKGKAAMLGISLLVALTVGVRFLRRYLERRRKATASAA